MQLFIKDCTTAMEQKNYTLKQLGQKTGISSKRLKTLFGKGDDPLLSEILKLGSLLGLDFNLYLTEQEDYSRVYPSVNEQGGR